jgi:hypothetical protein
MHFDLVALELHLPPSSAMKSRRFIRLPRPLGQAASAGFRAQVLSRFEVDDQLKFGRLHNPGDRWAFHFENPSGVDAEPAVRIGQTGSITHQPASSGELAQIINRRHRIARRPFNQSIATAHEQGVGVDQQCVDVLLRKGC